MGGAPGPGDLVDRRALRRPALLAHGLLEFLRQAEPGPEERLAAVGLLPQHGRAGVQQVSHLLGHEGEHLGRRGAVGHQGGDPAQGVLFPAGAAAVGDVAGGGVDEPRLGDRPGAPLKPDLRAVAAQAAVLEPGRFGAVGQPCEGLPGARAVLLVHELDERPGQELLARTAQDAFEGGVDPFEPAVEPADAEQVEGEVEDARQLLFGLLAPSVRRRAGGHGGVHAADELPPGALERGLVGAVFEAVAVDRGVHGADLGDQTLGGHPQFAQGVGDLARLVAARVPDVVGEIAVRQCPGARGDLAEGAGDRPAEGDGEEGDEGEHGERGGEIADHAGLRLAAVLACGGVEFAGGPVLNAAQGADAGTGVGEPAFVRRPSGGLRAGGGQQVADLADGPAGVLEPEGVQLGPQVGRGVLPEGVQLCRLQGGPASGAGGAVGGPGEQGGDLGPLPFRGLDGSQEREVGVGGAARGPGGAAGFQRGRVVEQGVLDFAVPLGDVGGGERAGGRPGPQGVQLTADGVQVTGDVGAGPEGGTGHGPLQDPAGGLFGRGPHRPVAGPRAQPGLDGGEPLACDGVADLDDRERDPGAGAEVAQGPRLLPLGRGVEGGEDQQSGDRQQHQQRQLPADAQPGERRDAVRGPGLSSAC
ncbi:hypothetical protein M2163_003161 [Streptomyces sp. SAI-135]|nr:hypothetical protein [Streptomyces sp. SAI-135]